MRKDQTKVKAVLQAGTPGQQLTVMGWVRSKRGNKAVAFIALNDGSTIANLQVVVDVTLFSEELLRQITAGACIRVDGNVVESPGQQQRVELQAARIELLGTADPQAYPLQKKGHSLEFLREIAYLRPRTNTFGAILRLRHAMSYAIHEFFHSKGFYYLHTPLITSSDAEGAGARFRVTNTPRHLAEFWMIEPEMAFYDIHDNMDLAEEMLKYLTRYALEHCEDDLKFLNDNWDKELLERLHFVLEHEFVRLGYTEAIGILEQADRKWEFPVKWGVDLQSEHERYLVEEHFHKPVILTDYPAEIKAFYMKQNEDGKTVRAMDVLFPKIGEIIGGSERESDYTKLKSKIDALGIPEKDVWWYLDTRRFGTAPHSGFGLGFERLMLFITGMGNIRDVIPFPRTPGHCEF